MKVGLFFGSFNPVHSGHMIIANYMATQTDLDEVWLVVSPQNPFKKKETLADDYRRLDLVHIAIDDTPKLKASDIEFKLPQPSYTIDTLVHLRELHPDKTFTLIMGGDNLPQLPKWKNYEILLRDYRIYVFDRPGHDAGEMAGHPSIRIMENTPRMEISASYIRECIRTNKSIRYLVPDKVHNEILRSRLYK